MSTVCQFNEKKSSKCIMINLTKKTVNLYIFQVDENRYVNLTEKIPQIV